MALSRQTIEKMMKDKLKDHTFIVASSAEPYVHTYVKDSIKVTRGAGGVITALEPILKMNKGLWIAHGRGSADKDVVDQNDKIKMPPRSREYTLKRLWISKKQLKGWYYGFANQALWPLCHSVFERPVFDQNDWNSYTEVNTIFAEAILKESEGKKTVVWLQDYHLALVSKMLKEKRPDLLIGYFWHIPWPVANIFQICPWTKELLEGMLGNDLIGFQRHNNCKNFLASVAKILEAKVDFDAMTITYKDKITYVKHYPISIEYQSVFQSSTKSKNFGKSYIKKNVTNSAYEYLSLGVERLDYTKGLPERIKAIDRFLEKYPEYIGKFLHINILVPSRTLIKRYEDLDQEIQALIENVNFKYATSKWQPIHIVSEALPPAKLYNFYKSAQLSLVTSLADGMNLVAKEYVTAGPDDGCLILSDQTGAADELTDALLVNPYDVERLADMIKVGLEMSKEDKKARIQKMRNIISEKNIYQWSMKFINDLMDHKPAVDPTQAISINNSKL